VTITAKIVADSVGPSGVRLTTLECTYPLMVHAQVLTHRAFSRNSASSRAIPTARLVEQVRSNPVTPLRWLANEPGMVGRSELAGDALAIAAHRWTRAADYAAEYAERLAEVGLHKQYANRVIGWALNITTLLSATSWTDWDRQRLPDDAQPEIQELARQIKAARDGSTPRVLEAGAWHMPYVDELEVDTMLADGVDPRYVSAARCGRVTLGRAGSSRTWAEDEKRGEGFRAAGHMSPLEHVAQAVTTETWNATMVEALADAMRRRVPFVAPLGNFSGWVQLRKYGGER